MDAKQSKITQVTQRLLEMNDEMKEGIANASKVKNLQTDLVAILKEHSPEKFKEFIESNEKELKNLEKQIAELTRRQLLLDECLKQFEEYPTLKEFAAKFCDAFGVIKFNND